jgi:CheY-like chemotaxis protein
MESKKIIIIDDDPDILESLKVILQSQGFEVLTASNREDGIQLCSSQKPDLIILDIMMEKDLDGYGMLNDFRKEGSLMDVPIIMYSGMAEQIGVNFRSAVEDEKTFPRVSFVDKRDGTKELIPEVNKLLKE